MSDINPLSRTREDEYFARQEFERRKKIAEEHAAHLKKKELEALKKEHWMRCPKDGLELIEIEYHGIKIDKCSHCGGIYLDAGELEGLLEASKEQRGLLRKVFGFVK